MGQDIIDVNLPVILLLKADGDLQSLVGTNIYGPPLGVPIGVSQPQSFVVLQWDDNEMSEDVPIGEAQFQFHCHAKTYPTAMSIWRAVHNVVHRLNSYTNGSYILRNGAMIGGPWPIDDPELPQWPRVVGRFRVDYIEGWS